MDDPLGTADRPQPGPVRPPPSPVESSDGAVRPIHLPVRPFHPSVPPPADEPVSVVLVGAGSDSRGAVLGALLGERLPVTRPAETFMIVSYGPTARVAAFLPGWSHPWLIPAGAAAPRVGLGLPRPARRIEMSRPDPLLRHFSLVDTPDLDTLRSAGLAVVHDTMTRAGALLFVIGAGPPPGPMAHDLLRQAVAAAVEVFFVVTPGGVQSESDRPHRTALLAAVPEVEAAPWFVLDPAGQPQLHRTLIDWADREALHRAGAGLSALAGLDGPAGFDGIDPPGGHPPSGRGTVTTAGPAVIGAAAGSAAVADWSALLDRTVQRAGQRVRHTVSIELAHIHLAAVQEILFRGGPAVVPDFLDRELLALSVRAAAECAGAVDGVVDEMTGLLLGAENLVALRQPLRELLRRRMLIDPLPTASVAGLLATAGGRIEPVAPTPSREPLDGVVLPGTQPDMFAAYPVQWSRSMVPPIGLALAADCWHPHDGPAGMAPNQARSWTQRMLWAMELDLARELAVRFTAIRRGLASLLADTIDSGDPQR
ncbi:hypothetical protein [Micromonospora sp. LOL_023]|uniref:hypothetical protein n=1 Tax=Micromonospora sp. LOL_023 TaxID=3345418 RepID=UPI003A8944D8